MKLRLEKPWLELDDANVSRLTGQLGVYELASVAGTVSYIGYAGGRSLFGLRGELARHLGDTTGAKARFRVEVNQQYQTRWRELLMLHAADHGRVPELNEGESLPRLGRLG